MEWVYDDDKLDLAIGGSGMTLAMLPVAQNNEKLPTVESRSPVVAPARSETTTSQVMVFKGRPAISLIFLRRHRRPPACGGSGPGGMRRAAGRDLAARFQHPVRAHGHRAHPPPPRISQIPDALDVAAA